MVRCPYCGSTETWTGDNGEHEDSELGWWCDGCGEWFGDDDLKEQYQNNEPGDVVTVVWFNQFFVKVMYQEIDRTIRFILSNVRLNVDYAAAVATEKLDTSVQRRYFKTPTDALIKHLKQVALDKGLDIPF